MQLHSCKSSVIQAIIVTADHVPFALDLMTVDSDIVLNWTRPSTISSKLLYCVIVVNSTSSSIVHSKCNITDTNFIYPEPFDADCNLYSFTVTATGENFEATDTEVYHGANTRT